MSCSHCGSPNHTSCPFRGRSPYISLVATPSRPSPYHQEREFERRVVLGDRPAYKQLVDGGVQPDRVVGARKLLRSLGG